MTDVALEGRALEKAYDGGRIEALRDVSLEVHAGEILAISGPSGSGKSTLLHLLGGLDTPTRGDVLYRGTNLSRLRSLDEYRSQHVGFVFQAFHLLPTLTAVQNVQIPMFESRLGRRQREEKARGLLEDVGLGHRLGHYPGQLSAGERQRVALARSLANDPDVLLADEPTGNLDTENATAILDLLCRFRSARGATLVVVTHDPVVAARAQRVISLRDGRVCPAVAS
ncbi:MAG: ABC transporter ATP-binding protein [Acidobacteria bacterium]|nr:ABC transporter ATP-binding protein [Acidobacteriota bacterium]